MYCQKCGRPLESDSNFCPACGQPAAGQPFSAGNGEKRTDAGSAGMGVASMVCGILGALFFWTIIPGIVLGIVALALGLGELKRNPGPRKGKAVAGVVLGIAAIALSALMIVLIALMFPFNPDISGFEVNSI